MATTDNAHSAPRTAYVGRFAPSPTGLLHLGSLYAAVISWLDARSAGGRWLLRIEDLDPPRTQQGAADAIARTLQAHALHWDGQITRQSEQDARYQAAIDQLAARGLLFRCACTRQMLRAHGGVYPGTCRDRGMAPQRGASAIRMRVNAEPISFTDRLMGQHTANLAADPGDFVLHRRDGFWAYQLAVVVDDAAQGVTDVVRGVDLIDSTPRQIWLQHNLGLATPRYLHHALLLQGDGSKLSKQSGAPAIADADARANLGRILRFLGLPSDPLAPPATQLAEALASWRPERLPTEDRTVADAPSEPARFC